MPIELGTDPPPRTGRPCKIFPVATLTEFASGDAQSLILPAEQLRSKPSLPYTTFDFDTWLE
jgi:hypothetical protein